MPPQLTKCSSGIPTTDVIVGPRLAKFWTTRYSLHYNLGTKCVLVAKHEPGHHQLYLGLLCLRSIQNPP